MSLLCIWCSTTNTRWKLIQEGCAGQLYRFVPRLMAPAPDEGGPPELKCLSFIDVSAAAGTLETHFWAGPAVLGQMAALEAGRISVGDVDVNALFASLTFTLPDNVGGFVVAGEAFGVDTSVAGASQLDVAHQVLEVGRGSSLTASGPLLQVAGWAWYAGLSELEVGAGTKSVRLELHATLPLAWISVKDQRGNWTTLTAADGQAASWWIDPCALGTRGSQLGIASSSDLTR